MLATVNIQDRPLPMKMRQDLVVQPHFYGGKRYWGVKDPLALQFYHLQDEEYTILCLLNGEATVSSIRHTFERKYAPQKLSTPQLYSFLELLHREGLIISDRSGQAVELYSRGQEATRRAYFAQMTNLLAIRFRGLDPSTFLDTTYPYVKWFFSSFVVICGLMFGSAALGLLIVQIDVVSTRIPTMQAFLHPGNLIWMMVTLACIKILHELGHAYVCKHFGGECYELGLMLLAFTPCLYCNVTDAWMFRSKWKRIAVSAAGIYIELLLASAATFLWWFSEPGLLNAICFNVMTICSVGTLLVNGNPLLRYDGYFILSDLLEVPNLQQQSLAIWKHWLQKIFVGYTSANQRMLTHRLSILLPLYGIASYLYRWVVIYVILWFIHRTLKPYRLEEIARLFTVFMIVSMLAVPVWRAMMFLFDPLRNYRVNWFRFAFFASIVLAIVAGILAIPLPRTVTVAVVMEPENATRVYVHVPGMLQFAVTEGEDVKQGDKLARLTNYDLDRELETILSNRDQQQTKLDNLKKQQVTNPFAQQQIQSATALLKDLNTRFEKRTQQIKKLTLNSPVTGTVLSAPRREEASNEAEDSPRWIGSPLDKNNIGCLLETGTLFCLIGDKHQLTAMALVNQSEIESIQINQTVTLQINQISDSFLKGKVIEIAEAELKLPPRQFSGEEKATENQQSEALLQTGYRVRIKLDVQTTTLLQGAKGQAKIKVAPQSLGTRLIRYIVKTFRFQW